MQFIREFFKFVHDDSVIGLAELNKKSNYVYIKVPKEYKNTFIQNTERNYLLL